MVRLAITGTVILLGAAALVSESTAQTRGKDTRGGSADVQALQAELRQLREKIDSLEARVSRLSAAVEKKGPSGFGEFGKRFKEDGKDLKRFDWKKKFEKKAPFGGPAGSGFGGPGMGDTTGRGPGAGGGPAAGSMAGMERQLDAILNELKALRAEMRAGPRR